MQIRAAVALLSMAVVGAAAAAVRHPDASFYWYNLPIAAPFGVFLLERLPAARLKPLVVDGIVLGLPLAMPCSRWMASVVLLSDHQRPVVAPRR